MISIEEEVCSKIGCKKTMYCFAGKDKTTTPRLCPKANELLDRLLKSMREDINYSFGLE
jgi:hypothetical protein